MSESNVEVQVKRYNYTRAKAVAAEERHFHYADDAQIYLMFSGTNNLLLSYSCLFF